MGAYQQMGHQSQNLLTDVDLANYTGVVASPVNYDEAELATHIATAKFRRGFDVVFDPQMYVPSTERGCLKTWKYFPADVDTADVASAAWWTTIVTEIVNAAERVKARAVCSPAIVPKVYSDAYFEQLLANGVALKEKVAMTELRPIQTLVVSLPELAAYDRVMTIASLASGSKCPDIYLVLVGDKAPRREFDDPEEVKGAMRLIAALRKANMEVFVAFASSDVVLWKAAGAAHCGTGKFFNLRRFTRSRFDEPTDGGGQLPYWFEEALLAFIRASDLQRIQKAGMLSVASTANPFSNQIFAAIQSNKPWIALAWRQYLYWFADVQSRIDRGEFNVKNVLEAVEKNWQALDTREPQILMDEPANNGSWVRQWRRAVLEYPHPD